MSTLRVDFVAKETGEWAVAASDSSVGVMSSPIPITCLSPLDQLSLLFGSEAERVHNHVPAIWTTWLNRCNCSSPLRFDQNSASTILDAFSWRHYLAFETEKSLDLMCLLVAQGVILGSDLEGLSMREQHDS